MKISVCFMQLPSSLLVAALALTVSALPVESTELLVLNPDNFDSTVAKGVWFVEHFSPYCGHCRNFLPTWTQLVDNVQNQTDPGIHLAQVNCAVDGDLCKQHGVDGYPQMNLYKDGKYVETYKESRAYDLLTAYLSKYAEPTSIPEPEPAPAPTPTPILQVNTAPEVKDPAPLGQPEKDLNPNGAVLSLNPKTFKAAVDEGKVFVKFFAPWCGHCKKLAPIWKQLAAKMQHKLTIAEVDCDAHNALCHAEGVAGFPQLVYYAGNGGGKTEYTNARKLDQLKAFADKVSGPVVQTMEFAEFADRVAEHSVLYLFLHAPSDTRSVNQVLKASQVLFGSPPVYTSDSSLFYDYFSVQPGSSVVLALKDHDPAPAAVYTIASTNQHEALVNWFLRNRLPASMELDSDTFQEVMNAPHKPLVVLAAAPKAQLAVTASAVQKIARQWRDDKGDAGITFVWMDADKWADWLKSMYGVKAKDMPSVVVANHSRLVYYNVDQFGQPIQLTSTSIFSTIAGAMSATIPYKHSENAVERMARYLNGKLTSAEVYVTTYPWRTVFFVTTTLAVIFYVLKRLVFDYPEGSDYPYGNGMRKADRID